MLPAAGRQHRGCIIPHLVTHSLVLIGRNHRPKHVELIGIINKPLFLHLFKLSTLFISMMHGHADIKFKT